MSVYNLSNIKAYLVGNFRYKLWGTPWEKLMFKHIRQQIKFRIKYMSPPCYNNGSCEICGCETPALQMANKACGSPCYPSMMNRKDWKRFKGGSMYYDQDLKCLWLLLDSELLKFKNYKDYVEKTAFRFRQNQATD